MSIGYLKRTLQFKYLIFLCLLACNTDPVSELETDDITLQQQYQPLVIGNFIVYKVKKDTYSAFADKVSESYWLKEKVDDVLISSNDVFLMKRYKRKNTQEKWKLDSIWTQTWRNRQLIKTEHNIPFVKLQIPLRVSESWNGNLYNNLSKEDFNVSSVDSRLVIVHRDITSLIKKRYAVETFEKGIGLVEKTYETYDYVSDSQNPNFGKSKIVNGVFYSQVFHEKGKE